LSIASSAARVWRSASSRICRPPTPYTPPHAPANTRACRCASTGNAFNMAVLHAGTAERHVWGWASNVSVAATWWGPTRQITTS
jgi:hypothetical protein